MHFTPYTYFALLVLALAVTYSLAYWIGRLDERDALASPAQNVLIIENFAAMVNETDEDFELAEEPDARAYHQVNAEHVLDQWLTTIDASNEAMERARALLRWKS